MLKVDDVFKQTNRKTEVNSIQLRKETLKEKIVYMMFVSFLSFCSSLVVLLLFIISNRSYLSRYQK